MTTFIEKLNNIWRKNNSMVCVGLDPDLEKLPPCLADAKYPIFEFNRAIIDATKNSVCAYKPQSAYYAGQNADDELAMTIDYILSEYPEIPVILDVKRGDIGPTASMYAREAFDRYRADALTINAYMGFDTVKPFADRADKGVFVLCRTSNPNSGDLQNFTSNGRKLYEEVALLCRDRWNYNGNLGMVVGATYPEELKAIRELCPEMPLLVPGVGAQGGDARKVAEFGKATSGFGLLVNSSRGIIYASNDEDFAVSAGREAEKLRVELQ